jgi:hypothetical protein
MNIGFEDEIKENIIFTYEAQRKMLGPFVNRLRTISVT